MDGAVHLTILDRGHELSGVVRPGESWAAAARRTCASLHVTPVPIDLSGEVKRFVVDHDRVVALRAMGRGDLPDVARWRAADHVRPWFDADGEPTLEAVTEHYGPRIDGVEPTRMWVVEVNGRSVGFCQDYRLRDHPDYAALSPDPDAVGVDYVIGEAHLVGQGIGTVMLWTWLHRSRKRYPDVTSYFSAPDHRNGASLRVLEKVGFVQGTWFDQPRADGSTVTLVGCTLDVASVVG
ncbi:GNAT family N-acetyltransferase [Nocardioides coralli]|uniref:GNAT family N-acetyltransferase n=1 Tax=Nocardioides coralli TaxID=2872154 RepID=UPI001CA45D5B|nr:GNAT family N-acetyltransferase [Nocardioides coralli]QZY30431.1 acetyltransferase [Nocardioides coralli]